MQVRLTPPIFTKGRERTEVARDGVTTRHEPLEHERGDTGSKRLWGRGAKGVKVALDVGARGRRLVE